MILGGGFAALGDRLPAAHAHARRRELTRRLRHATRSSSGRTRSTSLRRRPGRPARRSRHAVRAPDITLIAAASAGRPERPAGRARGQVAARLRQARDRHRRRYEPRGGPGPRRARGDDLDRRTMLGVRERFEQRARRGARRRAQHACSSSCRRTTSAPGPLYEIVFMLETWLRRQTPREPSTLTWSTYRADATSRRSARGCTRSSTASSPSAGSTATPTRSSPRSRRTRSRYADGSVARFDQLISFPPLRRSGALRRRCRPTSAASSRPTRRHARCSATPDIYAPATPATSPSSRPSSRFLQADTVAEHIAAGVARPSTFATRVRPGEHVHHGDVRQGDLRAGAASSDRRPRAPGERPPRRRRRLQGRDRPLGASARSCSASTLPMRFGAGEPFHAGHGWQIDGRWSARWRASAVDAPYLP